jgi:hypothetical protein
MHNHFKKGSMHFSRDVFTHEEASFKMPGGSVFSQTTGVGLGVGGSCLETPPLD